MAKSPVMGVRLEKLPAIGVNVFTEKAEQAHSKIPHPGTAGNHRHRCRAAHVPPILGISLREGPGIRVPVRVLCTAKGSQLLAPFTRSRPRGERTVR